MNFDQFPDKVEISKIAENIPVKEEQVLASNIVSKNKSEEEGGGSLVNDQEKIAVLRAETEKIFDLIENPEGDIFKTLNDIAKPGYQYRAIGTEGFRDIQESRLIRANQNPDPVVKDVEAGISLKAKHFDAPFFVSNDHIQTLQKFSPEYVVEIPQKTNEYTIAHPSSGGHFGNVPWGNDGKKLSSLPVEYATVYKQVSDGYQKVDV
jgi:hypothetical protein